MRTPGSSDNDQRSFVIHGTVTLTMARW